MSAPFSHEIDARASDAFTLPDVRTGVRAAFLALDRAALERQMVRCQVTRVTRVMDSCSSGGSQLLEVEVEEGIARAFAAVLDGTGATRELEEVAGRAVGAKLAAAVVEICALRALFALEAGDERGGLLLARRASLMARTEGIADAELLANLVLARARRYNRQAHLALRILEAIERIAPPAWRPWLEWERVLAGGPPLGGPAPDQRPASSIVGLLSAARAGDLARFWALAEAACAANVAAPLRRDAAALVAALAPDPSSEAVELLRAGIDPRVRDTVSAWRYGAVSLPPPALHGLAVGGLDGHEDAADEHAAVYVVMPPRRPSFRCLRVGLPLLREPDIARLRPSRRLNGRTETLLAVLALAGQAGLDDATCFARAYGFAYVPDLHRGVFDVLLHRARGAVQGVAHVDRASGRTALSATRALLVPDPGTSQSMSDRVLRLLAERGRTSAKQAAAGLGVSLRAVQGALTELAAADACVVERHGRSVTYAIEDSVFSEPTQRFADLGSPRGRAEGLAGGG